jgi:hypothetical protein
MVLGSQGPGRVGRRRFFHQRAAFGRPVFVPRARPAMLSELWPRFVALYSGYEHYKSIATRELPVVILDPR